LFQKDHIPILIDLPNTFDYADIYFIHDVHYGSDLFDDKKWEELKTFVTNFNSQFGKFQGIE
jgi:hypothetical protein